MSYKIGDEIVIVNPRWIKRVGYPLHWHDLRADVEADPRVTEFLRQLGYNNQYIPPYFVQAVAKLQVEARGFGGNERSIHYWPLGSTDGLDAFFDTIPSHGYVGHRLVVTGKRVAYTGKRIPQRSGTTYTADGPDYWHDPGGLENRKAHVILKTGVGEIEACDVRPA